MSRFNEHGFTLERPWQLYRLRRYALALEETMKFLGQQPESAEAHCLLALIHGKEDRQEQAITAAEAAIKYAPDWSHPYYVHSMLHYWFDQHHQALRALSEAIRLQPNDPDYYELLSSIHSQQGHINTSLETADQGLKHRPQHVGCLYRRGVALFDLNKMKEAEEVFRTILSIDSEHAATQGFVGHFELLHGRYADALPLLRSALRENPDWELAQSDWKESLRSQYRFYGDIARLKQWIFEKYQWRAFFTHFAIVFPCAYYWSNPDRQDFLQIIPGVVAIALFLTILSMAGVYFLLTAYLSVISRILLISNRELRRSFNWIELFQDYRNILFIFILIMLTMITLFRQPR